MSCAGRHGPQALHIFERDALLQQVRDRGDTKGVRRIEQGQADVFETALHHVKKLLYEAESDEFEKTRQACLYIDIRNGVPVTPAEQISEGRARTLVILAGELMAEVLGHFPWEFERMLNAVMTFEEEIGLPPKKVTRR